MIWNYFLYSNNCFNQFNADGYICSSKIHLFITTALFNLPLMMQRRDSAQDCCFQGLSAHAEWHRKLHFLQLKISSILGNSSVFSSWRGNNQIHCTKETTILNKAKWIGMWNLSWLNGWQCVCCQHSVPWRYSQYLCLCLLLTQFDLSNLILLQEISRKSWFPSAAVLMEAVLDRFQWLILVNGFYFKKNTKVLSARVFSL